MSAPRKRNVKLNMNSRTLDHLRSALSNQLNSKFSSVEEQRETLGLISKAEEPKGIKIKHEITLLTTNKVKDVKPREEH